MQQKRLSTLQIVQVHALWHSVHSNIFVESFIVLATTDIVALTVVTKQTIEVGGAKTVRAAGGGSPAPRPPACLPACLPGCWSLGKNKAVRKNCHDFFVVACCSKYFQKTEITFAPRCERRFLGVWMKPPDRTSYLDTESRKRSKGQRVDGI